MIPEIIAVDAKEHKETAGHTGGVERQEMIGPLN
jgi:hypothetical protein